MTTTPTPYRPRARELAVLAGCARGLSNQQIADTLQLPEDTVKTRLKSITRRARARSSAHLVGLAYRHGWLAGLAPEDYEWPTLTAVQEITLRDLADGLDTAQIAARRHITPDAVRSNTVRLYRALGITGTPRARARAVALAHQHGPLNTTRRQGQ